MTLKLLSTGSYLPEKIVSNELLPTSLNTTHEWIYSRTGICQRHISAEHETCHFMALQASHAAIAAADLSPDQIDLIIVASTTQEQRLPSLACYLQGSLKRKNIPAFDVQAVCAGFVYALELASAMSIKYGNILVVGAERMSRIIDWTDRSTCTLFGDGAGAVVVKRDTHNQNLLDSIIYADGSMTSILCTTDSIDNKQILTMSGQEVFKHGVQKMSDVAKEILAKNHLSIDDISFCIPHQANIRIIDAIAQKLQISNDKMVCAIHMHANCSAASIPLALDYLFKTNRPKSNELIMTLGLGAGLAWGANLLYC